MSWTVKPSPSDFPDYDRLVEADDGKHYRIRLRESLPGGLGLVTRGWPCAADGTGDFGPDDDFAEMPHTLISPPADINQWLETIAIITAKDAHQTNLIRIALGGVSVEVTL